MVPQLRAAYNEQFSEEKYQKFLADIEKTYPGRLDFRIAETPIFIPKWFTKKMLDACDAIVQTISTNSYKQQSARAVPPQWQVPSENEHPHCIAFDFGICKGEQELEPQLIELQGFPSLFAWQVLLPQIHARHFGQPPGYSPYLNKYDAESYVQLLRKIIVGDADPEETILLEILPDQQKTRIDFTATEILIGIKTVCITSLVAQGRQLFYTRKDGSLQKVRRIYNRVIFDDLEQQSSEVQEKGKILMQDLDVNWVPHPSWFYKISKFSLPFIQHPYVPPTRFLSDVKTVPHDLENYVAKPLFSFAGQGVIIDVTREALQEIKDPQHWILQRKVQYADVIDTPDGPAKAEIRLFYFWDEGTLKPIAANNLSRLSKGKMVGVRYNKDKQWVGGSFCYFEQ